MRELLFSKDFHQQEKTRMHKSYRDFIEDLRIDFRNGFTTDAVDENFLEQLAEIIEDECFDRFSPLKFYWLNLVDNIVYLIQMHEELLGDDEITTDELMSIEDELFQFWDSSDLAESFQQFLDEGSPVIEASNSLLPLIENQIISFYLLHFNQHHQQFDDALIYQTVPELGDTENKIFIGDVHKFIHLKEEPETFPSLPIRELDPEKNSIAIEVLDRPVSLNVEGPLAPKVLFDYKFFVLSTHEEHYQDTLNQISRAMTLIKTYAPHLFAALKSFSSTFVPQYNEDIESYSLKSLPGYSILKCVSRSDLNMAIDIVLENAHHFLNTILYSEDFFNEEDEEVFFNPWQLDLTPVKDFYTALFTSFWPMELCYNMLKAQEKFSALDIEQMKKRFLEDYFKIERSRREIDSAFKAKQITKSAQQLINGVFTRQFEYKQEAAQLMDQAKSEHSSLYQDLQVLLKHLDGQREL